MVNGVAKAWSGKHLTESRSITNTIICAGLYEADCSGQEADAKTFPVPASAEDFWHDLEFIMELISFGPCKSFSYSRYDQA